MRAQMTKNAVIVPDGRQGRLLPAHGARRPGRAARRGRAQLRHLHPRRCSTSPTTSSTARSSSPRACACSTTTTPTSSSPPTRARRRSRTRPTAVARELRLLARRRVRVGRLDGLRPQGARHHRARRVGVGQAPLPRARRRPAVRRVHRRRASATCRGDVFGNGMLLSRQASGSSPPTTTATSSSTPTPTRRRASPSASGCSSSPRSSWDDYDRELISEGGGVWPRTAKRIPLSRAGARRARHRGRGARRPTEVIRAILRAPVDLLWNGGIGTVVKASTETDADARGPLVSDAIRVDAAELRCRVVGEGGNLGLTRRARIEYAARRRAHQRRLHRQLGRRRLLRPRGQPEDPARPRRARAASSTPRGARRAAARGHRRRRRARALRLVPAGADHRPGGRAARPRGMFAYEDLMARARGARACSTARRGPADLRGDGRAPARGPRAWSGPSSRCCWPTPSAA